jgi:hypothetical protein
VPRKFLDCTSATAKSVLGVNLVEEQLHVAVLVGLDRWLGERAVLALLLLQLGQRFLRALEHGAGQLVLVDGVVARPLPKMTLGL